MIKVRCVPIPPHPTDVLPSRKCIEVAPHQHGSEHTVMLLSIEPQNGLGWRGPQRSQIDSSWKGPLIQILSRQFDLSSAPKHMACLVNSCWRKFQPHVPRAAIAHPVLQHQQWWVKLHRSTRAAHTQHKASAGCSLTSNSFLHSLPQFPQGKGD